MYLQMLASAQPYVFGTAQRTDLPTAGDPNLGDPGLNNARPDSDGNKFWGSWLGMNLNETNNQPQQPYTPIFQAVEDRNTPKTPSPYLPSWNQQQSQQGGYTSPWVAPATQPATTQSQQFVGGLAPATPQTGQPTQTTGTNNFSLPSSRTSGSTTGTPRPDSKPNRTGNTLGSQLGLGQPTVGANQLMATMPANSWLSETRGTELRNDGTTVPLNQNNREWASEAGTQFALEQLQRLNPGGNLGVTSASPTQGPFAWAPQTAITAKGSPNQGQNAGLVANTYANTPQAMADAMMRDEMIAMGILQGEPTRIMAGGGLLQLLAKGGVVGMDSGGILDSQTGSDTNVPEGAITGMPVGSYTPYPGQRFGEMGDLTNMYMAGTQRMNESLVDPSQTIYSPIELGNYSMQRMAEGFTDPDMAYHTQIRDWSQQTPMNTYQAGSYDPAQYSAANLMGGNAGALAGYTGGNYQAVNTGNFTDPGVAQSYMNPYQQNVTDIQKAKATEAYQEALPQIGANAVAAGAFGGGRHGVVEGMANREYTRQLDEIQKTGLNDAYLNAQQQFERDRSAGLQADLANQGQYGQVQDRNLSGLTSLSGQGLEAALQSANLNEQSRQFGANLTDTGRQRQSELDMEAAKTAEGIQSSVVGTNLNAMNARQDAAAGMMDASGQYTTNLNNQLNSLRSAGAQADAYNQQYLDYNYQNFLNQRDYPLQMMSYYSNLLNGVPTTVSTEQYTQGQQASPYSGILGLATAGLGAMGSYYNQG